MIRTAHLSSSAVRRTLVVFSLVAFGCDDDDSGKQDTKDPSTEQDAGDPPLDDGDELPVDDADDESPDDDNDVLDASVPDAGETPDAGEVDAGERPDAGDGGADAGTDAGHVPVESCSTTVAAADNAFVELCAIDGPVRHVRIDGLHAPQVHASTQVVFGFPSTPPSSNPSIGEGQFQVLFYGGGLPLPGPMVVRKFGAHQTTWTEGTSFMHTPATVCFDVHDGSSELPPYFVLWVDRQRGASCSEPATLTLTTAFGVELAGPAGAIDKATPVFFRQASAQEATVTVSSRPALLDVSARTADPGR